MHVVYVCHEYHPAPAGGIGASVSTLARGMADAGHRVTVIGFYEREDGSDRDGKVEVRRLPLPDGGRAWNWVLLRARLRDEIAALHREDPVLVVEWPDWHGWFLRSIPGIADVLKVHGGLISHRVHGFERGGFRNRLYERLELRMMRKIPNWVGVSGWFNEEWKRHSGAAPAREAIVYNPVDTDRFRPVAGRDGRTVYYCGGLKRRKGVLSLARAARRFLPENPGSRLVLVGFEADLKWADVSAEAGRSAGCIEFLPYMSQDRLAEQMAQAEAYAMPSLYESCGNGWIEAMSCGVPVVGSTGSCGPEIVRDGVTGLLANPEDPDDIAAKISAILRDRTLADRLGKAGREEALARFSVKVGVRTSEAFYRACAGRTI